MKEVLLLFECVFFSKNEAVVLLKFGIIMLEAIVLFVEGRTKPLPNLNGDNLLSCS